MKKRAKDFWPLVSREVFFRRFVSFRSKVGFTVKQYRQSRPSPRQICEVTHRRCDAQQKTHPGRRPMLPSVSVLLFLVVLFVAPSMVRTGRFSHAFLCRVAPSRRVDVTCFCTGPLSAQRAVQQPFFPRAADLLPFLLRLTHSQGLMTPAMRTAISARTSAPAMSNAKPLNRRTMVRAATAAFAFADVAAARAMHVPGCGCGECGAQQSAAAHGAGCDCGECNAHGEGCSCAACSSAHGEGCACAACSPGHGVDCPCAACQ